MDQENIPHVDIRPRSSPGKIAALAKPSVNPPTTAKMIKAMELKRKRLEERRKKEEEKVLEEKARKEKLQKV